MKIPRNVVFSLLIFIVFSTVISAGNGVVVDKETSIVKDKGWFHGVAVKTCAEVHDYQYIHSAGVDFKSWAIWPDKVLHTWAWIYAVDETGYQTSYKVYDEDGSTGGWVSRVRDVADDTVKVTGRCRAKIKRWDGKELYRDASATLEAKDPPIKQAIEFRENIVDRQGTEFFACIIWLIVCFSATLLVFPLMIAPLFKNLFRFSGEID